MQIYKKIFVMPAVVSLLLLAAACTSSQATPPAQSSATNLASTAESSASATAAVVNEDSSSAESGALSYVIVPEQSEARYRIREQLVELSLPNDAVGVTRGISGTLTINPDGSIVTSESRFQVDLTQLTSDRSRRDNFVQRNVLNTSQYPYAVFVPTRLSGLPSPLPQSGDVSFTLAGDLTILDVTRPVEWQVTATVTGGELAGKAATSLTFADFNLSQPRVPVVLSVEDTIKLELDFVLKAGEG